jgi:putative ABC transport system permease protein
MTAVDILVFAGRALSGHRLRTGLSLLGVAVGVTSVVLLTSLGEGARLYVVGEFAALGSNLLIVTPGKIETSGLAPPVGSAPHDLTLDDVTAIERRVPRIRHVAPMVIGSVTARAGDLTRDVVVAGVTPEWKSVRRLNVGIGQFLPPGEAGADASVCVVGAAIQRELFQGANPLGETLRLGDERFRIIGVIAPRGTSLGMDLDQIVIIPLARHMKMFNLTSLFRVLVEVSSQDDLPAAQRAVIEILKARHDDEEDVTVQTQESMLTTFSHLLSMLTMALAGIAAISLSVAGVGIMNVMLVSVSERTPEIGLLKALGASSGQILRLFLAEAATLSAAGGVAGLGAAIGLIALARRLYPSFPVQPPPWAIPLAVIVSLAVGVLFGVAPARRASKLDPVAALSRR